MRTTSTSDASGSTSDSIGSIPTALPGGTWTLGDREVTRFGYGAMQLAGPWVMGPPADHDGALAVLRAVVRAGITHIDTSDAYGPRVTNDLIREALHPTRGRCSSPPRSVRTATRGAAGPPPADPKTCAARSRTTCRPWEWTCWTW